MRGLRPTRSQLVPSKIDVKIAGIVAASDINTFSWAVAAWTRSLGDIVVDIGYFDVVVEIEWEELCGVRLAFKHNSRELSVDEEFT